MASRTGPDPTRVRIVVSADPQRGRGHLSRGMALATALVSAGADADLVPIAGTLTRTEADRMAAHGVHVSAAGADRARAASDVLVVDVPDPNDAPRLSGAADGERLVVFDDLSAFAGSAAIVVQPSSRRWTGTARASRVLAGYEYVPISDRYREIARRPASSRAGSGRMERPRVLVAFGGSDPDGVTERLGPAVVAERAWRTDVIVGPGHSEKPGLLLDTIIRDPHDLPHRLAAADVAVLAAGTMKFEAACLGVPMVLVAAADDQLAVGPEFAGTGAALWAGDGRTLDPAVVRDLVAGLVADPVARADLRERARSIVDGHGADRLSEAIIELALSLPGPRRSGGYRRRARVASQS